MTAKLDGTNGLIQQYDYQVLTTGFSYTFAAGTNVLVINPAGTLATGTVTMPASPADGMTITVTSTQPITALTVNANTGQTINNGGALGLSAGGSLSYVYRSANTAWQPFNAGLPIGVGQTWQNVTGSRVLGTTYTNSTGRPIFVAIGAVGVVAIAQLTINSINCGQVGTSGGVRAPLTGVVPSGGTYYVSSVTGTASVESWAELR
jgi:hypothetical protein